MGKILNREVTMVLYLIQHGEAKSSEEDPDRPLTDAGASDTKKIAAFFKKLKKEINVIWHSDKKRAEQTAEILADVLDAKDRLESWEDGMAPKDDIATVKKKIEKSDQDSIALVGHLPHLSRLASDLLTGNQYREVVHFKNAGIVCLSDENESWQVEWIVTPEIVT
jgi:phosphohistidine phosphatase